MVQTRKCDRSCQGRQILKGCTSGGMEFKTVLGRQLFSVCRCICICKHSEVSVYIWSCVFDHIPEVYMPYNGSTGSSTLVSQSPIKLLCCSFIKSDCWEHQPIGLHIHHTHYVSIVFVQALGVRFSSYYNFFIQIIPLLSVNLLTVLWYLWHISPSSTWSKKTCGVTPCSIKSFCKQAKMAKHLQQSQYHYYKILHLHF